MDIVFSLAVFKFYNCTSTKSLEPFFYVMYLKIRVVFKDMFGIYSFKDVFSTAEEGNRPVGITVNVFCMKWKIYRE